MTLNQNSNAVFSNNYTYDVQSRIATVGDGTNTAAYTRKPGTNLLDTTTITAGGVTKLTTTRSYDNLYRLTSISSASSAPSVVKTYSYTYDTKDRRTQLNMADGTSWVYGYDDNGQIVSGVKHDADGKAIPGQSFGYDYDGIGNLTSEQRNIAAMNITYTANNVNQYTSRTFPGIAPVIGEADTDVAIKAIRTDIRDPAYADTMIVPVRDGKYFSGMFRNIANTAAPVNVTYDVYATKNDTANNQQLIKKQSESFLVPKRDQSFTPDADGNTLSTGVWNYTYNAENQLISAVQAGKTKLEFTYDFASRRTSQKTYSWVNGAWSLSKHLKFAYYGFKLLAEYDGATDIVLRRYFWSGDKLEWMYDGSTVYYYVIDGNKNVTALVDSSGNIAAEYSYDPFGKIIAQSGPMADVNPFRFSSEYFDAETGLVYYNFRYYSPDLRRWISRDPIGEKGGVNIYSMIGNNAVNKIDKLGKGPNDDVLKQNFDTGKAIADIASNPMLPDTSNGLGWLEGAFVFYAKIGGVIHVPFSAVDVGWDFSDFGLDPCVYSQGSHIIIREKMYDLYNTRDPKSFNNGGPGRINFRLKGILKVDECKKWAFKGTVSAPFNDFDFDPQPWGVRDWWKEVITDGVYYGQFIGLGKDFTVEFDGERQVESSGDCRK